MIRSRRPKATLFVKPVEAQLQMEAIANSKIYPIAVDCGQWRSASGDRCGHDAWQSGSSVYKPT
ncbi:MAG: DUF2019 domain-containing protein [Bradyrhizobiaceae bacterium]|nr:MAG: DUF2019 domain-containing protein [Bradyrhizobiaceae bacterium]